MAHGFLIAPRRQRRNADIGLPTPPVATRAWWTTQISCDATSSPGSVRGRTWLQLPRRAAHKVVTDSTDVVSALAFLICLQVWRNSERTVI